MPTILAVPPSLDRGADGTPILEDLDSRRCSLVVQQRRRLAQLQALFEAGDSAGDSAGESTGDSADDTASSEPASGGECPEALLLRLAAAGLLSFRPTSCRSTAFPSNISAPRAQADGDGDGGAMLDIWYAPSRVANASLAEPAAAERFPGAVHKKQVKALRASTGALFRFPAETGDEALEVFITDWSPCPVAAALAVHADHPFVTEVEKGDVEKGEGVSFSGRFVRHPLSGDLLPVWIADWVKSGFGTGAVLVNPAHDATDLDFARRTGLPIRFGLVPPEYDGSPATWPLPPVIKAGVASRSGVCDGVPAAEAAEQYFDLLSARGLAERHVDVQAGQWCIGRLRLGTAAEAKELAWRPGTRTLLAAGASGAPEDVAQEDVAQEVSAELVDGELLAAAAALAQPSAEPVLVCPAAEVAGTLLAVRALVRDLHGYDLTTQEVISVQKVQESKAEVAAEDSAEDAAQVIDLALLGAAPLAQVAVLKQQVLDQAARFLRLHQELVTAPPVSAEELPVDKLDWNQAKPVTQVLDALRLEPARAFAALYQLQKRLVKGDSDPASCRGYFVLAWLFAGLGGPAGYDLPSDPPSR